MIAQCFMNKKIFRHEVKFPIKKVNEAVFYTWLTKNWNYKKEHNTRFVNNIYFDTLNLNSLKENIIGLGNKTKVRLRWYGDDDSKIFLEFKIKYNRIGKKIIIPLDIKLNKINLKNVFTKQLLKNQYYNSEIVNFLNNKKLIPLTKVSYKRKYYKINNDLRFTYDEKINYSLYKVNNFSKPLYDDFNVLEMKANSNGNEENINYLKKVPFQNTRFSKYLRSMAFHKKTIYY